MTQEQLEAHEDAKAAAAFDGPSTPEERLYFRIGGTASDLFHMTQGASDDIPEMIAAARELISLLKRLSVMDHKSLWA